MTERPILFSGSMVRAILGGQKTMTRRVVKPQPSVDLLPARTPFESLTPLDGWTWAHDSNGKAVYPWRIVGLPAPSGRSHEYPCPYGVPGDRLWVKETYSVAPTPGCTYGEAMMGRKLSVTYDADGARKDLVGGSMNGPGFHVDIAAAEFPSDKYGTKRPSIYMFRWASRLTLEVTGIRVERVQAITRADCIAEGIDPRQDLPTDTPAIRETWPVEVFRNLWDSINAGRGYGWTANPWVWVVEFRVI